MRFGHRHWASRKSSRTGTWCTRTDSLRLAHAPLQLQLPQYRSRPVHYVFEFPPRDGLVRTTPATTSFNSSTDCFRAGRQIPRTTSSGDFTSYEFLDYAIHTPPANFRKEPQALELGAPLVVATSTSVCGTSGLPAQGSFRRHQGAMAPTRRRAVGPGVS